MTGADIHDHRDIRMGYIRKIGDLAEMVHAHLQDRHLRGFRHGEDRHRHTDIVIVVGRGLFRDVSRFKDSGDHFFRGALAHGACDADDLRADALQLFPGDLPQRDPGIIHVDGGPVSDLAAAKNCRGALLHGGPDEVMAVSRALEDDKELAGLQSTGIIGSTQKLNICIFIFHMATAPCGCLLQCDLTHRYSSFPRRWAATSSRSSR